MNKIFLLAGGAAVLYWWYSRSATAAPHPAGTTPGVTVPAGTTTTPAPAGPSELATIYNQLVANAGQGLTGKLTPYQWNYSLGIVRPALTPPDPVAVFGSEAAAAAPMTASEYWRVMSPYLIAHLGLSGLGYAGRRRPYLSLPMGYA